MEGRPSTAERGLVLLDRSLKILAYDRGATSILRDANQPAVQPLSLPKEILDNIRQCKLTSLSAGVGLDQEWPVETGTWRRAGRRLDISEGGCCERRRNRTRGGPGDELKCRSGMIRRFGGQQLIATG